MVSVNIYYLLFSKGYQERNLSLKDADEENILLVNELTDMNRSKVPFVKMSFLNNAKLLLSAREKILNSFKSKILTKKILDDTPFLEQTFGPTPDLTVFDISKRTKAKTT